IALARPLRHHRGNETDLTLFFRNRFSHLNFVANPLLLVFTSSLSRPFGLRIVRILHHSGRMYFDRLYLAIGFHYELLSEDFSQQRYLLAMAKLARARL